jgi:V8-like Glu-specific endopeptidase
MRERTRFEAEVADLEIFPPNSLTRVADNTAAPFRWICHVVTTMKNGDNYGGTGVLISPRHVLTSAHVIYPIEAKKETPVQKVTNIRVYPGRHGGREPFDGHDANGWAVHPNWNNGKETNCTFDYGLIRLKKNFPDRRFKALGNQTLGYWGRAAGTRFAPIDPSTLDGRRLFTAGYPFRKGLGELAARVMKQSEGVVIGSAAPRRCSQSKFEAPPLSIPHVQQDARILLHDVDTEKGQSGGPVWVVDDGTLTMVAIHQGTIPHSGTPVHNLAVILTKEVFDQVNDWMRNFVE